MPRKPKEVVYALDLAEDAECTVWRVCYLGETGRGQETRDAEHEDLVGGAGRVAASVAKHGRRRHRVRVVDVVVDDDDRKALETFLILEHDTLLKNRQQMRDLLAHENREFDHKYPDISLDGQPLNFQLNQVRSVSAKHDARVKAAGEAYEARQAKGTLTLFTPKEEKALFKRIDADLAANEGLDEPLSRMLVAREAKDDGGRVITLDARTPFGKARELRDKYKELDAGAEVDRDTVSAELTSIGELPLYKLKEPDAEVQAMVVMWQQIVHPNKQRLRGKKLTAGYAAAMFEVAFHWCGEYEEAELEARVEGQELNKDRSGKGMKLCDHVARAKTWRDWAREHDGAMPKRDADDPEEKRLAKERDSWSSKFKQLCQPVYLIFLRDVAGFASDCLGRRGGGVNKAAVQVRVKRLLHSGLGFQQKDRRGIPKSCAECGADDKAYALLHNYVNGQSPEDGIFLQGIVNDVFTQARFDVLKSKHEAKRPESLERLAKHNAAKRRRGSSSAADAAEAVLEETPVDEDAAPPSPETVDAGDAMEEGA